MDRNLFNDRWQPERTGQQRQHKGYEDQKGNTGEDIGSQMCDFMTQILLPIIIKVHDDFS